MDYERDRTWFEIDLDAVNHNYKSILKGIHGDCGVIAVLKANAYGLGVVPLGKALEAAGCGYFAVATLEEAMSMREAGIKAPVMLMGPSNINHLYKAFQNNIQLLITGAEQAAEISAKAKSLGIQVKGNLKIDTGLSRFGIMVKDRMAEAAQEIEKIMALPHLSIETAFTHTTCSSMPGGEALEQFQFGLFDQLMSVLRKKGISLKRHCLSSYNLSRYPQYQYEYVRVGVLLLGMNPKDCQGYAVKQSVSLKSLIWDTKDLPRYTPVSYGPTFSTLRPTKAALVPIGFADGLRRSISNQGFMLVHGKKAPVIGKVCCDYTILDITDIPQAKRGDLVTIFGADGGITQYPYDYAQLYPASVCEVTASFTERIPRFYLKQGRILSH